MPPIPRRRRNGPPPWPTSPPRVDAEIAGVNGRAEDATGLFGTIGTTGLNRQSGFVYEEFLHELQGIQGRRVYREMRDNDAVVAALLFSITMLVRKVEWEIKPANESAAAKKVAQFVESCLHDMSDSWQDTLQSIQTMYVWGWSYLELVYKLRGGDSDNAEERSKYDDGLIGWRKWSIRAQESLYHWEFGPDGGVRGLWQSPPPDFKLRFVPIEKALLFRTSNDKGNPEGVSLLRRAYRSWYFRKWIEQIEGIGIERDLAGLPVLWAPTELFAANLSGDLSTTATNLKAIVRNIRRDEQEGVFLPLEYDPATKQPRYKLELLSTGGQRQFDTDKTKQYYATQALMTVLADFILVGHQGTGSYNLSQDKSELFGEAVGAFADGIAHVVNSHGFPRLLRLNGIDTKLTPELTHTRVEKLDVGKVATAIRDLSLAGMPLFPNPDVERVLYEALDIPVPADIVEGGAVPAESRYDTHEEAEDDQQPGGASGEGEGKERDSGDRPEDDDAAEKEQRKRPRGRAARSAHAR